MPFEPLFLLAAAALLTRVGLLLYTAGISRSKNAASATARVFFDLCLAILAFWAIGAALFFQKSGDVFGLATQFLFGWDLLHWNAYGQAPQSVLFVPIAILIATGSVVGTLVERTRFFAAASATLLLAGLILPVTLNWTSRGWLHDMKFVDNAGAASLHLVAGMTAAVGAYLTGPRTGKYHRDGSASMIPGHSVPLTAAGAMIIFVGWLPYVAGFAEMHDASTLRPMFHVLLAGAAAGFAATIVSQIRYGKPDLLLALLGFLGGLVAITGIAGQVNVGTIPAVLVGLVAGIIIPLASIYLDLIAHIDDPAGTIAVHGLGGLWGALAAGLFAPGSFAERAKQLGVQSLGVLAIGALAFALATALFYTLKKSGKLRSKEADEFDGLDLAQHDIAAYPDFQQTTIKSYHLREA